MATQSTDRFDLGRIWSNTGRVLRENARPITVLALIYAVAPGVLAGALVVALDRAIPALDLALTLLSIGLVIGATHYTSATLRGGPRSSKVVGRSITRNFGMMIVIQIVAGVAILLGLVLLIAPGLFLMVILSCCGPVRVVEATGLPETFRRSTELTRGYRWQVLGALLSCYAPLAIVLAACGFALLNAPTVNLLVAAPLLTGVTTALAAVFGAALYCELKRLKQGPVLGSIFD